MLINIHSHKLNSTSKAILFLEGREFIGLHPWNIKIEGLDSDWEKIKQEILVKRPPIIGETGLDRHFVKLDISIQEAMLVKHINLAASLKLPLVIHCVHAHSDLLKIFKQYKHLNLTWLIHDYSAGTTELKQYLKYDVYFSFGKSLFNQSSKAYRSFLQAPVERVFFETDDADLEVEPIYQEAMKIRPGINWENQIEINLLKFFKQADNISAADFIKNFGLSI